MKSLIGKSTWNITFLIISFITFGQCTPDKDVHKHLYGQENAVWTESIYLRGYNPTTNESLTDEHIRKYAETLKKNKVKYAYLFAGPYGEDGHLPDYAFSETAINSVKLLKKIYPQIVILPWVGGVQNKTVYLGDSLWVKNALDDTEKLIRTLSVPGVHVDLEYILAGDAYLDQTINKEKPGDREAYPENVNEFHRRLRSLLPEAFISSVVVATAPDTKPWKRKTTIGELKTLTQYIDQLSFLYYDTQINDQIVFERNCRKQLEDIEILKGAKDIQYLLAIGTFINNPALQKYRDLRIENIPNSLKTIRRQVAQTDSTKQLVNGIAIFCDWETEEEEWEDFYNNWSGV